MMSRYKQMTGNLFHLYLSILFCAKPYKGWIILILWYYSLHIIAFLDLSNFERKRRNLDQRCGIMHQCSILLNLFYYKSTQPRLTAKVVFQLSCTECWYKHTRIKAPHMSNSDLWKLCSHFNYFRFTFHPNLLDEILLRFIKT